MPIYHHQCRVCYCTVRIDESHMTDEEEKIDLLGGDVKTIWLDEEICPDCERNMYKEQRQAQEDLLDD